MDSFVLRKKIALDSKILIIDDLKINRLMLMECCKYGGFRHIEEACDGQEGLDKIIEWKPDLIFTDMNMPHMNGLQLCLELQRQKLLGNMVVIMHTVVDKPSFKAQAFDAGIADFITPPFEEKEVLSRMMAHLERLFMHRKIELDYSRIHTELKEVAVLQGILLPNPLLLNDIKSMRGLDVSHYFRPATELAGDYLSVRKLSGKSVMLISVDVSGHGVKAALYAFLIHTLLEDSIIDNQMPGAILDVLNVKLHGLMPKGTFATIFLGLIDPTTRQLHYAGAASPHPMLLSEEKITMLNTRGCPLAVQKKSRYETHSVPFISGDTLFIYSDALLETANAEGNFIQEQVISDLLLANKLDDPSALIEHVLAVFMNYSKKLRDDLSILVCRAL